MPLADLAEQYLDARHRRGEIDASTVANYRNHLRGFLASWGDRPVDELTHHAVEAWQEAQHLAGYADATRSVQLSTLRGFARWCVADGHVAADWTTLAPKVRRSRQVPRDLTNDHVDAILEAAGDDVRARLVVWLMFGCGLRCVEVARLQVDDVDHASGLLFVTGKGGHQRFVPAARPVLAAVDAYLAGAGHHSGHLIRRVRGGATPVSSSRLSHLIAKLIRDAGLKLRRYDGRSAHGLRAAAASDLYDACSDPRIVQQFLGHRHLSTTSVYLRRAEVAAVAEAVARRFAA